jgi:replicative DNA helicase
MSGATVGIFSLEMSSQQLFQRLLAGEARVNLQSLRTGALSDDDWAKVTAAHERLAHARIFVDDTASIGPMEIRSKARRLKYEHGLSLLLIDYLQMMKLETPAENRQQEVSEISRSLKAIAKELQTPVLAVSQLSRQPEMARSADRRPQLSDLRDSGAIEQDADIVMFIYRPEVYEKDKQKVLEQGLDGKAEVIIAKQRNGPIDTVNLYFVKECTRFETQADSPRF